MWYYKGEVFLDLIEGFESFVYIIERLNVIEEPSKPILYIGKKVFYNSKKNKNKREIIESDWYDYYGSSKDLSEDVALYGKHNFKRHILHLCRTKGDSGYLEIKEQIDRKVLYVDDNNYKLYYNKNINGRYHSHPDNFELGEDLKLYFQSRFSQGNNHNKKWITNGNVNKVLSVKECEKIVGKNNWVYGKIPKKIEINNGIDNFYKDSDYTLKTNESYGFIRVGVTDGENNKLLLIEELNDFLKNNKSWYKGFSGNKNMVWVTNGSIDKKINIDDKDEHKDFYFGRTNIANKDKISMFKDGLFIFIDKDESDKMLKEGWVKKGKSTGTKYNVTNGVDEKKFYNEEDKNIFLKENQLWRNGQAFRENFNTENKVFAIDMKTLEKVCVSKEEYNNNNNLTSIKSKKIKVKEKHRIIFEGYIKEFEQRFDIPTSLIKESAREGGKIIHRVKGRYTKYNDFKYSAKYV